MRLRLSSLAGLWISILIIIVVAAALLNSLRQCAINGEMLSNGKRLVQLAEYAGMNGHLDD